jgi:hypothetical protein
MKPARLITTHEGKFMSVSDFKAALKDDTFVAECAHVLAVGYQRGDGSIEALRRAIGLAVMVLAGEERKETTP